jgi:hypothetical protein
VNGDCGEWVRLTFVVSVLVFPFVVSVSVFPFVVSVLVFPFVVSLSVFPFVVSLSNHEVHMPSVDGWIESKNR